MKESSVGIEVGGGVWQEREGRRARRRRAPRERNMLGKGSLGDTHL